MLLLLRLFYPPVVSRTYSRSHRSKPLALLHSHDRAVPILAGVTLFAGRQPLTIQTQLDLLLLSLPRYASTRVRIIH